MLDQLLPLAWSLTAGGQFFGVLFNSPEASDSKQQILAWDIESGDRLGSLQTDATDLELSPDGRLVAVAHEKGFVEIWSLADSNPTARLTNGHARISCMAWAKDRLQRVDSKGPDWLLAVGSAGGDLTIWDLNTQLPRSYCHGSAHGVHRVAFSPDGMTLASVGRDHPMLWDVASGQLLIRLGEQNTMTSVGFSPDGKSLAVGAISRFGSHGEVNVWNIEERRGQQVLRGLMAPVSQVCFSSNNRVLAALAQNWQLAVWDLQAHRLLHVFEAPKGLYAQSAGLAVDAEGRQVAVVAGTEASVWDVTTGSQIASHKQLPNGFLDSLAFHGTDELLLIRQESVDPLLRPYGPNINPAKTPRVCRIRNLLTANPLEPLLEIADFRHSVMQILATPDGKRVLIEGHDANNPNRLIKLYELPSGRIVWEKARAEFPGHQLLGFVDTTGKKLSLNEYSIWEIESGFQVLSTKNSLMGIGPGANLYVAEGHQLATDRNVRALVRAKDEVALLTLDDSFNAISPTPFSVDGELVAWGIRDGAVRVCDIRTIRKSLAEAGLNWTDQ